MDRDMFKQQVHSALSRLPKSLLDDVASLASKIIGEHRTTIEAILPALVAELIPQVQVIALEKAMGYLDVKEVEADVMEVLARFGFKEIPTSGRPEVGG